MVKGGGILAMHVEQRLFPRLICSRPGILHFSRVLCVCQSDPEMVTTGMAARGGANVTMASMNDDGWTPYLFTNHS
jgi:hypothetical protein